MMYRCYVCDPPCTLSIDGTPTQVCPHSEKGDFCAWVEIEGMFSTVVPA